MVALAAACLLAVPFAALAEDGFTVVYDGKDLSGVETEGNWQIQPDGALYLEPRPGEKGWTRYGSYLWVKGDYTDFVFDFEYKHEKGGNSGFYFRVIDKAEPTDSGFEVQIMDSTGKADAEMGHHDLGGVIRTQGASRNMSKSPRSSIHWQGCHSLTPAPKAAITPWSRSDTSARYPPAINSSRQASNAAWLLWLKTSRS